MKQYEECGYVVDPSKLPSRGAKAATKKMPHQKWPEPRAKHKGAMTVFDDEWPKGKEAAEPLEGKLQQLHQAESEKVAVQVSQPA